MTVWLPLRGLNDKGLPPKACGITGWNDPTYKGVDPEAVSGWIGMRLDDFVVIDCDDEAAFRAWLQHIGHTAGSGWVRKTPHGYHIIYRRTLDSYGITGRKLTTISPKLELKTGVGHQVVFRAPGYSNMSGDGPSHSLDFDVRWLPVEREKDRGIPEWSEMPEGIGNNAMISFAGKFREWGMDQDTIERCLAAVNEITMTEDPMGRREIRTLARQAAKYETGAHEATVVQCPSCGNDMEVL